jgi:hypothetical protein
MANPHQARGGTDATDLFLSLPSWEGDGMARSRAYPSTWVRVAIKTRLKMGAGARSADLNRCTVAGAVACHHHTARPRAC